jgi:hypothetical protein
MHRKIKIPSKMRKIVHGLTTGILLFSFACTSTQKTEEKAPETPNVIMILVDDMGYGDLSFYGQKPYRPQSLIKWPRMAYILPICTQALQCVHLPGLH